MASPSDNRLNDLPAARGIYQITDGRVSYVGLTDNIRRRLRKHLDSRSCRSRIVLDTGRARVIVLELLPRASDRTLAEREWYWFERLQQQGQILVNDPKSLGRTSSGRYGPPQELNLTSAAAASSAPKRIEPLTWWLSAAAVGVLGFGGGFLAMQTWLYWRATRTAPTVLEEPTTFTETCWEPLKRGDRGPKVRKLQEQLQQLGFLDGAADGIFGPGTQAAVADFQQQQAIAGTINGEVIAGCETQQALTAAIAEDSP